MRIACITHHGQAQQNNSLVITVRYSRVFVFAKHEDTASLTSCASSVHRSMACFFLLVCLFVRMSCRPLFVLCDRFFIVVLRVYFHIATRYCEKNLCTCMTYQIVNIILRDKTYIAII